MNLELFHVKLFTTEKRNVGAFEIPQGLENLYLELLKKGPPLYNVKLSTLTKTRSTGKWSQNHHFNGHCQQISNETGNPFESVKTYVKRMAIARGLRLSTNTKGEIVYSLLDGEPEPISEKLMTVEECGWCIEEAHILAAEMSIVLVEE